MAIDTHTHFYDPNRTQGVPWPPSDNELLYRTVLPPHLKTLAEPVGITGTVVVEASPWVDDNQWILDLAEKEPYIVGFVGNLDPDSDTFDADLDRLSENPIFRGIRIGRGHLQGGALARSGVRRLADNDLSLDILAGPDQLSLVADLARKLPDMRIVLNHVAHVPIDGLTPDAAWIDGLHAVAEFPQVFCKVSGMVEMAKKSPAPVEMAYYAPTMDHLWEILGEDRLIYGSNWPVCERAVDYATVYRIAEEYFASIGSEALKKVFYSNPTLAYGIRERTG